MPVESELVKAAEKFRQAAADIERYAPVLEQLQELLDGIKTPGKKAAEEAKPKKASPKKEEKGSAQIKAQPNHAGQLPTKQGEFGEKAVAAK